MEVAELIAKLGRCEQDIFTDSNNYRALKWRINDPGTLHDNEDLQKMKDLYPAFLLCKSIINKQKQDSQCLHRHRRFRCWNPRKWVRP